MPYEQPIEEAMIDMNNFGGENDQNLNVDNLGLHPEERETSQDKAAEDPEVNDKGFKWTQDKDEILINNYS